MFSRFFKSYRMVLLHFWTHEEYKRVEMMLKITKILVNSVNLAYFRLPSCKSWYGSISTLEKAFSFKASGSIKKNSVKSNYMPERDFQRMLVCALICDS